MPSWVTAVNDAPASSVKNTRDAIARCPDDDTGRNSVRPCSIARTITWTHDIAATSVTTTTVPVGVRTANYQRLGRATGCAAATASRTAAARLRWSERSMSVSLRVPAATMSSLLRHRPAQPRAVDLDDQRLAFDVERKASAVADLAKPASVHTSRNVLDSKLSVVQFPVCGEGHVSDHNSTHASVAGGRDDRHANSGRGVCLHLQFERYPIRTSESYPLPIRVNSQDQVFRFLAFALAIAGLSACTSDRVDAPPPTIVPAEAAASPPPAGTPAGSVRPLAGHAQTAVFDANTGSLAVLSPQPAEQSVITTLTEARRDPVGAVARARDSDDGR